MYRSGLAVLFLLASWFSAACAYELLPAHVAVVYNGKSKLSRRMAREYARVRGVPEGNLVSLDCPMTGEISRKEYEETIRVPLLETARKQRWWTPSGIASSPLMDRKIFVLALMADLPMKIRHETPAPLPGKGVNQMQTDRAAVDSELALLAVGGYERKSWQVNPYFNKREDFVGAGLPSFLVCRLDGLTPDTCMRLVTEPAKVEKQGLWGWAVVDRGGPYAQGDRWMDDVFKRVREAGIPVYLDDWPQTLPEKFPLSRDTALYCGWYAGKANGPFSDPSFRFRPGAIAMHLHSFSAADFKVPGKGWSSALLEKGAAVTVGNVYEPFLGACHRFDIFVDRLLDGYTVAEASWMSMPVLSWQGVVFGDPLYRPYARMKDMDVEPTEEDRYFQGWWASSVQFGDRWKDRSARLTESARKAPFSCLYEALALECLYRKEPARAGEFLSSALDGAANARTRARLLLEILLVERARGGNKAFLQRADGIRGLMSSSAFLPALEEWLARVAPPPAPPKK
ncbi:TIGR03790 family protein [uncultured Akkermansia sp.]|uniref:TIGR03790 family protein n=1 Tax=uncultured Akkermansia sp. TaxID=512294 RepID=UPI0028040178|nr:TIGR03790 family protein [uncultured Akkermansia sp.]